MTETVSGVISGEASNADAVPVAHAVVTVIDSAGRQSGRARADSDGRFAITGLTPDRYTVMIAASGYPPLARTAVVVDGEGSVDLGRVVLSAPDTASHTQDRDAGEQPTGLLGDPEPSVPVEVPKGSRRAVLKRAVEKSRRDKLLDHAATLTYYSLLSIFPGLVVLAGVAAMLGPSARQTLIDNVNAVVPGPGRDVLISAIGELQQSQVLAVSLLVAGTAGVLWAASGYLAAFIRVSTAIYEMPEGRPAARIWPARLAVTLAVVVLLALCAVGAVVTGTLAERVGQLVGIDSTGVRVWDTVKWPVIVVLVGLAFALLYRAAPNAKDRGLRWLTPGAALAVLVWIVVSAGFALYLLNFSSYNKTIGSLAAAIVFLVWLWISNAAVVLGAELDAQLSHEQRIRSASPATNRVTPPANASADPPSPDRIRGPERASRGRDRSG